MKDVVTYTAHPYRQTVQLCLTEKAIKRAAKALNFDAPMDALGFTAYPILGPITIYVADGCPMTLLHECTHATLAVLDHVGIDPQSSRGEPMCYLLEHMYAHFFKALSRASTLASTRPDGCTTEAS